MRVCYACIFISGRLDSLMRRFFGKQDWAAYYLSLYEDGRSQGWRYARDAIHRLAEFSKAHGVALLVASLPELHDVQNYRFQAVTELVRQATMEDGVAFVDVLPYLKDQPSAKLWVTPPDPHPNAFANQWIAQGLFDALQRLEKNPLALLLTRRRISRETKAGATASPPPLAGEGQGEGMQTGRGHAAKLVQAHPLPNPLPQAGEGAHRVRRAFTQQIEQRRNHYSVAPPPGSEGLRTAPVARDAPAIDGNQSRIAALSSVAACSLPFGVMWP